MNAVCAALRLAYGMAIYGQWSCGYSDREDWPNKPYLFAGHVYYDGDHAVLHLWRFWVAIDL